jgi:hypothetical protein
MVKGRPFVFSASHSTFRGHAGQDERCEAEITYKKSGDVAGKFHG